MCKYKYRFYEKWCILMNKIEELQKLIDDSNNIVFFDGAGTSTDSGIKDFRSKDGIYNMKTKYNAEELLSSRMFYNNTEDFYDFYKAYMNPLSAKPNVLHKYLKKLENMGKLKAVITQNIDGLHSRAGIENVYELHGTVYKNYCLKCKKSYSAKDVFDSDGIPKCSCGGLIKPNVVLYGEMLDEDTMNNAIKAIYNADLLIVAGSSLLVYPANQMINFFKGRNMVIINNSETPYDYKANLVIHDNIKKVFEKLK